MFWNSVICKTTERLKTENTTNRHFSVKFECLEFTPKLHQLKPLWPECKGERLNHFLCKKWVYYWWKLTCECPSTAQHTDSSKRTHSIDMYYLGACGPTTLQHMALTCITVQVMNSHLMQYNCEHVFTNLFPSIVVSCRLADSICFAYFARYKGVLGKEVKSGNCNCSHQVGGEFSCNARIFPSVLS